MPNSLLIKLLESAGLLATLRTRFAAVCNVPSSRPSSVLYSDSLKFDFDEVCAHFPSPPAWNITASRSGGGRRLDLLEGGAAPVFGNSDQRSRAVSLFQLHMDPHATSRPRIFSLGLDAQTLAAGDRS